MKLRLTLRRHLSNFLFAALISPAVLWAQMPVQWQAGYGGSGYEWPGNILQISDGFLIAGKSDSVVSGSKTNARIGSTDYWLVKVDTGGVKQWERSFGGIADDYLNWATPASDGGFILVGTSHSGSSGNKTTGSFGFGDFWLLKVDTNGNKIFERSFGGASNDFCYVVRNTSDGGYIFGGESASPASGNRTNVAFGGFDAWVVKVDANGNKQWDAAFGGSSDDGVNDITVVSDGYLLGCYSRSAISGNKTNGHFGVGDYWIIKINTNGVKQWERVYGGNQHDVLNSVKATGDGGFVLAGYSFSPASGNKTNATFGTDPNYDYWIIKVDSLGLKQWERSFGGTNNDYAISIIPAHGGGFIIGGYSSSGASGNKTLPSYGSDDYWIVKIDDNGNRQWEQAFGGSDNDWLYDTIIPTADGGYLLAGESESGITGNKTVGNFGSTDIWLVKLAGNPGLQITRSANNVLVSWPSAHAGFILQTNSLLGMPEWGNVSQIPSTDGTNNTVSLPIGAANVFFRLKK